MYMTIEELATIKREHFNMRYSNYFNGRRVSSYHCRNKVCDFRIRKLESGLSIVYEKIKLIFTYVTSLRNLKIKQKRIYYSFRPLLSIQIIMGLMKNQALIVSVGKNFI